MSSQRTGILSVVFFFSCNWMPHTIVSLTAGRRLSRSASIQFGCSLAVSNIIIQTNSMSSQRTGILSVALFFCMQLDASHHRKLHSRTRFVKICFYTVWLLTGSKQQHHTNKFNVLAENRNLVRCFFSACNWMPHTIVSLTAGH